MSFASVESWSLARLLTLALVRPRMVAAFWIGVLLVAIVGITHVRIDTSTNSFLDQGDPAWDIYERSLALYGGDELLVVALEGDEPWSAALLKEVVRLSDSLARIPGVRRVDSLATVPLIRAVNGHLHLDHGLADGVPSTHGEWEQYRGWLANDAIAPDSLVSDDGRVFAVNVLLDDDILGDRVSVVEAVRAELDGLRAWVTGVPVFRTEVNLRTLDQVLVFVPLTVLVLAGLLALAFRGVQAPVVALSVGGIGAACGLGALGLTGAPLSLTTAVLPSLMLALGSAYSMHILTRARGRRTRESLRSALAPALTPLALSGLTTVIGFLAMATIPVAAIRELATYGALGVFVATFAALSLAPAIVVLWPLAGERTALDKWVAGPFRRRLVTLAVRHRRRATWAWAAIAIVGGCGLAQLFYATDIIDWFPRGTAVREEYEAVRELLSGITPVNVIVHSSDPAADVDVMRPPVLAAVDGLTLALRSREEVGKALSVADSVRQIHAVVSGSSAAGLPEDGSVIAQYLLLLESVDRMRDVLLLDHSGANILLRLDENSSRQIVELGDWVEAWWEEHGVAGVGVTTTGIMYEFGRAEEQIAQGQVRGLLLAFGVVGLILIVVFRDIRVAALGLAVNAIPLGIIFGGLGIAGVGLDAGIACIGSTALAIGVDDTIHLLSAFRERSRENLDAEAAIDGCFAAVLPALVFTTLAVGAGFLVLVMSPFALVANVGWVTAAIVVVCFFGDTTLLPALLARPLTKDRASDSKKAPNAVRRTGSPGSPVS